MTESERRPLLRAASSDSDQTSPLRTWKTKFACATVLITEMFERIAFYGLMCNLVMFLNVKPLDWTSDQSLDALYFFMGMSYISSLFGGFIADSGLNRFRTIILFLLIYVCGYIFFPLLVPPTQNQHHPTICKDYDCKWAVYLGMTIVALGVGAVKANIAPFGADQFNFGKWVTYQIASAFLSETTEDSRVRDVITMINKDGGPIASKYIVKHQSPHIHRMFFNWFYWCINIGAFIAVGVLGAVQQEWSFFWGYVIPNVCVVIALVVFLIGSSVYVKRPASGSVLGNVCKVLCESFRICCRKRRQPVVLSSHVAVETPSATPPASLGCLDYAKVRHGGSFQDSMVEDVKSLGKIFAVFLAMIPYWLVYFQMESTYVVQGLHMKLDFRNNTEDDGEKHHIKIAVAWLSLFDVGFLLVLLPLLDLVVYPCLDRRGFSLTVRARIITGMVFAVFSVIIAGVVETLRLKSIWVSNDTMEVYKQYVVVGNDSTEYFASPTMSVLWQIPQYTLIGVSEAFANVAGLELAYMYAPRSMKAIIMGLFWFTQGLASLLGMGSLSVFKGLWFFEWDRGDINCRMNCYQNTTYHNGSDHNDIHCISLSKTQPTGEGIKLVGTHRCHLDYYFFFLAALQVLGIALFVWISWALKIGGRSRKTKPPFSANQNPRHSSRDAVRLEGEGEVARQQEPFSTAPTTDLANGGMSNIQRRHTRETSTESPLSTP